MVPAAEEAAEAVLPPLVPPFATTRCARRRRSCPRHRTRLPIHGVAVARSKRLQCQTACRWHAGGARTRPLDELQRPSSHQMELARSSELERSEHAHSITFKAKNDAYSAEIKFLSIHKNHGITFLRKVDASTSTTNLQPQKQVGSTRQVRIQHTNHNIIELECWKDSPTTTITSFKKRSLPSRDSTQIKFRKSYMFQCCWGNYIVVGTNIHITKTPAWHV